MTAPDIDHDAALAAERACRWLQSLGLRGELSDDIASGLGSLVALWICERRFPSIGRDNASAARARELARALDALPEDEAFAALLQCDARQVLLGYGILNRHGARSRHLGVFVGGLAQSLETGEASPAVDLYEVRFLLARLGLGPVPDALPIREKDIPPPVELLQADDETIRAVILRVAAASSYGTDDAILDPGPREKLSAVIPAWLIDLARRYGLDRVAQLIRTLEYLGTGGEAPSREAVRFLVAQQHPSGRFGFFGPEAAIARAETPAWDETRELSIPMALACLWTLAECRSTFRLMTSV